MDYQELTAWLLAAQTIIFSATLIVLTLQLRQLNESVHRDATLRTTEDQDRLNGLLLEYPELNQFMYAGFPAFAQLTKDEQAYYNFLSLVFGRFERLYLMHNAGWLDAQLWESWQYFMADAWFSSHIFSTFWAEEGRYYHSGFQDFVNHKYETFQRGLGNV